MASLRWKNYSACLGLLPVKVSCLICRSPLPQMFPPKPYLQLSGPGGSTNNRVLSCHYVVSRCAPDALSVERYLSSRACHQWKHLLRTLRLTGSVYFYDFCPRLSSTEASA